MATKNDDKCLANYEALKVYIDEHHHLPDKHKVEFRGLLNWASTNASASRMGGG